MPILTLKYTVRSFVSQGFNWIELGRLPRAIIAEENSHHLWTRPRSWIGVGRIRNAASLAGPGEYSIDPLLKRWSDSSAGQVCRPSIFVCCSERSEKINWCKRDLAASSSCSFPRID